MRSRISLAKVTTRPPARVRNPWERWLGSWDWKERPTWTTPQPRRMRPMARIREKMKEDRLFTTPSGSFAARAVVERQHMEIARAEYAVKPKRPFLPKGFACV